MITGLPHIKPRSLRHFFAALAVQAGANMEVLQKAMGHSDIRLTLDTYGGLFGDNLDALAKVWIVPPPRAFSPQMVPFPRCTFLRKLQISNKL